MSTFAQELVSLFDDPTAVWKSIFVSELDDIGQRALLTMATFPLPIDLENLEFAIQGQATVAVGVAGIDPSLRPLEDTFVKFGSRRLWSDDRAIEYVTVDFLNPSLLDFALATLDADPAYIRRLQPFEFFEQLHRVAQLATEVRGSEGSPTFPNIRAHVGRHQADLLIAAAALVESAPCSLGGLAGESRLRAILGLIGQFEASEGEPVRSVLGPKVLPLWSAALDDGPTLQLVLAVRNPRARSFVSAASGTDPLLQCREAALGRPVGFDRMELIESIRRAQALQPGDEDMCRLEFDEWLQGLTEGLDSVDDESELNDWLSALDAVSYWISDERYHETKECLSERLHEVSRDEDWTEDPEPEQHDDSGVDADDEEIDAMMRSLRESG